MWWVRMKKKKILEKTIEELELNEKVLKVLKDNNINMVEELWVLKRQNLKSFGLKDSDITQITIKLQLYGLDLNKKIY